MTQDEIIEMAEQAGVAFSSDDYPDIWQTYMNVGKQEIKAFAKLIAAKAFQSGYEKGIAGFNEAVSLEREACAKVCEDDDRNAGDWHWKAHVGGYFAKAIRARGEQA